MKTKVVVEGEAKSDSKVPDCTKAYLSKGGRSLSLGFAFAGVSFARVAFARVGFPNFQNRLKIRDFPK